MIFRCFVTVPLGKCWWNICPWIPPDDRYSDIILFFCSPWLQLLKEIPQAIWYQQQEAGCICKLICWCHLGTCIYHLVSSKWRCVLPRKQRTLPMALCVLQSPSLTSDGIANSFGECQGGQQKAKHSWLIRSNMADMEAQEAHGHGSRHQDHSHPGGVSLKPVWGKPFLSDSICKWSFQ